MWLEISKELGCSWQEAEAMHWVLGKNELSARALTGEGQPYTPGGHAAEKASLQRARAAAALERLRAKDALQISQENPPSNISEHGPRLRRPPQSQKPQLNKKPLLGVDLEVSESLMQTVLLRSPNGWILRRASFLCNRCS